MNELEDGTALTLDWTKMQGVAATGHEVIPVVLQDATTDEVLFVAYANEEAFRATLDEGMAVLWSTSRNELWRKGATSGDVLQLVEVRVNCEQNSLLYRVNRTKGGACHVKDADGNTRPGCYYRRVDSPDAVTFDRD